MALTDQLAWAYEMNEASGNAVDVLAANDLTDTNTVTSTTGKVGGARYFTAVNAEYFTKADNSVLSFGDIDCTMLALVNMADKSDLGGSLHSIVTKDDAGTNREFHLIWSHTTDRFRITVFGSASGGNRTDREATTFGAPSISTWYGIWWWHDSVANTINIQVDGVSQGGIDSSAHTTGIYDGAAAFRIGDLAGGARNWSGAIDQVFGWKRVLSAGERTQIWNSNNWMSYADMVAAGGSTAALTGNLSTSAVQGLSSLAEFAVIGVDSSVSVNTVGIASELPLTSNLSTITVETVAASSAPPGEATDALSGVNCTASVGNVVGVNILPVTVGEYRHVAAGPITQRRPMRLKDLERIYQQMERKR